MLLELNKNLYSEKSIDICMERFNDICGISRRENNDYYEIIFSGLPVDDLEGISLEFGNQVLFFTKSGG